MRKVLPYLGASLSALALAWATPSLAQTTFKDVPADHWAYAAVSDLQSKQILDGYPDGYFRGKRTLTRYEFAVALKRALDKINTGTTAGPPGPAGPQGEAGPAGPPGMTPEEVANLRRLTDEFRSELTALGANVTAINSRLDGIDRSIAEIKDTLSRLPKVGVNAFFGVRFDRSRNNFVDGAGAVRNAQNTLFGTASVVHDIHIPITANFPGGAKLVTDLVASNYLSYRGSTLSEGAVANAPVGAGSFNNVTSNPGPGTRAYQEITTIYQAQLDIPIGGFGTNTVLTVGRYKHQVTPGTFYRPDLDPYFDVPVYDDGNFVQDGIKLDARFGSAHTSLFAGSYASVVDNTGAVFNRPLIGVGPYGASTGFPNTITSNGGKPYNIGPLGFGNNTSQGQVGADQVGGIHVGLPLFKLGELGLTLLDFNSNNNVFVGNSSIPTGTPFQNLVVYGANLKLNPFGKLTLSAEGAKSVTQRDISNGDGQFNDDNYYGNATLGYASGPIAVQAGYQYVDPRYGAPGYWNKLGNWYNPTNISGPSVRIAYHISNGLSVTLGGDYYGGARNRTIGLRTNDHVTRVAAGAKYTVNKKVSVGADYEGLFYNLGAGSNFNTTTTDETKPVEQYITANLGLNLAANTILKLGYQIINFQNVGNGFANTGLQGSFYNASVFTTQLAVRF